MGFKDIKIKTVSFAANASRIIAPVRGLTADHVMLNDSFPDALDEINWETSDGYLSIATANSEFGYAATITCILGIPDNS